METKQKTITVEIPEGKKAVWNEQGILQLVDDDKKANEPKDVTERIKTFYDAQYELEQRAEHGDCEARQLLEEFNSVNTEETSDDIVAYLQLRIITAALNEGWKPEFKVDGDRYYPIFDLLSREDVDALFDNEIAKQLCSPWDSSAVSGTISIHACRCSELCGYRLVYKTGELATYAARQFISVYARFLFGYAAKDATLRKVGEQKYKSSGNK